MGMISEFKEFAMKGNLIDMAVAFVMGGAFGKVVTGFIDGIVMPLVGKMTAGVDFKSLKYVLTEAQIDAAGVVTSPETAILYGSFITVIIDFTLVAFVMFLLVKGINKAKEAQSAKQAAEAPAPAAPVLTEDQKLLMEIRDLLKK